jgi:hypothetical protein
LNINVSMQIGGLEILVALDCRSAVQKSANKFAMHPAAPACAGSTLTSVSCFGIPTNMNRPLNIRPPGKVYRAGERGGHDEQEAQQPCRRFCPAL